LAHRPRSVSSLFILFNAISPVVGVCGRVLRLREVEDVGVLEAESVRGSSRSKVSAALKQASGYLGR